VKQPSFAFTREFHLSPRELEVIQGLANGEGQKEIASRLGISQSTVKRYTAEIREEFGGVPLSCAIAIAVQARLVRVRVFREVG
jgi:DNA-binding NarL/FixJ family response regulator